MINKYDFPRNEKEEKIAKFWSVRGYPIVKAVLGNMNVSFHRDNPRWDDNGLEYIYLEQFYNNAILEVCEELHKFCLKEGMKATDQERRGYTQMIMLLTRKFGELRK